MITLEQIRQHYEQYIDYTHEVKNNARAFDGFLGFGRDPKKDPCHRQFYLDLEKLIDEFAAQSPSPEEVKAVVTLMYEAAQIYSKEDLAVWMILAAEGHTIKLIPLLSPLDAKKLLDWYDKHNPRKHRLPIQEKVLKALKAQSKS